MTWWQTPKELATSTLKMQKVYYRLAVDIPRGIQRQEDSRSLEFSINYWHHYVCWRTLLVLRVCACPWPNTSMMSIIYAELEWPWIFLPLDYSWHIHCKLIVYPLQFLRVMSSFHHIFRLSIEPCWYPTLSISRWFSMELLPLFLFFENLLIWWVLYRSPCLIFF